MKKTKKRALYIVAALLAALFVLSCLVGFAACGGDSGNEDACADGHTVNSWTTTEEATCTEAGSKTGVCDVCGETVTDTIDALGHDYQLDEESTANVPATCTTDGTQALKCSRCGATTTETVAATGHSYETVYIEADEEGEVEAHWALVCSVCGDEQEIEDASELTFEVESDDELISAIALGGETVIADDITLSDTLEIEADVTLDLAGNTLSADLTGATSVTDAYDTITVESGATLTIVDSSSDGSGTISNTYSGVTSTNCVAAIEVKDGSVAMESGTIESSSVGIKAEGGEVTIDGGGIESAYFAIWVRATSTVTINDGTISGANKGILVAGGDAFGGYTRDDTETTVSTLNVTGGTISCEKDSAISTLGNTDGSQKVINLSGGTIIGPDLYDEETQDATPMPAVYNGCGDLTITGGTITGSTAVEHRGGTLTISGGTLTCNAQGEQSAQYTTSGATSYGYALTVYPFTTLWVETTVVSVTGGTFNGDIYIGENVLNGGVDDDGNEVTASISFTGGTVNGSFEIATGSAFTQNDIGSGVIINSQNS